MKVKDFGKDLKIWTIFEAARYIDGVLQEDINMSLMSGGHPHMVDIDSYMELYDHARNDEWLLDLYIKTMNKIEDYFEYSHTSEEDKKIVMEHISDLVQEIISDETSNSDS